MSWFTEQRDALTSKVKEITKRVTSIKPKISSLIGAGFDIGIDADIDAGIKVILDDSFLKVIDRAIFALDSVIDKTSQEFKSLVQQISDDLFKLERKINELIDKFFDNLSELIQDIKTNLVDPIVDSVFALEEKIFEDINQVIDKIFDFFTGTVQQFKDDLFVIFNPLPNPFDPCRRQLDIALTPTGRLTHIDLFNLFECRQLRRLDDDNTVVKEIQEVYAMLQLQSFRLTCLGRGSPAFQEIYMRKWLKYGQLFELWQEFAEDMTPQQAYDEAIRRLNQARNEYQAKVAEIELLQTTANTAVNKADAAQGTANSAVSKADDAQSTASSAVKGIKSFTIHTVIDTKKRENIINITFPEKVDFVALESIANDGNQMSQGRIIKRIDDKTFEVRFIGINPDGHRWIPDLRFVGIQIQK